MPYEDADTDIVAELEGDDSLNAALSSAEGGYPMYNIKVERGFYTVFELKRKNDQKKPRIILDSDFQRKNVWKPAQKEELIESILMGLPLPIFYFNQDKMGRLIVVDGRQRLTALFEFMNDQWCFRNLKVLGELNGKKFSELDPLAQSHIEDYQIQAHVIQPPTPDRIKFDIFDRVNRAGTRLNKQEIRNALYQGHSTQLLKRIAENKAFEKATEGAFVSNPRMKDRYIVLRYLAFSLYRNNKLFVNNSAFVYKNDIDELLGLTMEHINSMAEKDVVDLYDQVIESLNKTSAVLGENAFRLIRSDGSRGPINMNVFEVVMYLMSKVNAADQKRNKQLVGMLKSMKNSTEFLDAIGNHRDSWTKVDKRFCMMDRLLEELYA